MTCSNVQIKYPGDGTTVDFTIPFLYQEQSEVKVSLWDTTTQDYVSVTEYDGTDTQAAGHYYQWQNATVIRMVNQEGVNDPPPVPTEDTELNTTPPSLLIYRDTDLSSMNAEFYPGSSVKAQDLNSNFEQLQFAIEESKCDVETLKGDVALNYWNKTTETLYSGDTWQESDEFIVTAAAGDARWLNATGGDIVGGSGITVTEAGGNVTIDQTTLEPSPAGTFTNPIVTVDALGRVLTIIDGTSADGLAIIVNTLALNTLAATLGVDDAGTAVLVNDSTNIDGTVATPGANNPAPNPAVVGLPADAPAGGWNDTVQTSVQWTGTTWQFVRYGSANPDLRYINAVDGTPNTVADRQTIRFNGLDLASANNAQGDPIVGYEMRFTTDGNRTPQFQINAGTTENAEFQLAFGDQGGGVGTHGIYMNSGSTVTRAPRVTYTGSVNDNTIVMDYANVNGATAAVGRWELRANGDIQTNGDIILSNTNARVGVDQFDINIGATPTEDYTINLPPTGPAADDQILVSDAAGQLAWEDAGGAGVGTVIGPIANFTDPVTGQTNIQPGGQLFDDDTNRLFISVTSEPDGNGNTANVLVQLVP